MVKFLIKKYVPMFILCLIVVFSVTGHNIAHAQMATSVTNGMVSCHSSGDCIASATDVSYDMSFTTDDHTPVSQITVTFPSGYTIDTSTGYAELSSNEIMVNGVPVSAYATTTSSSIITINLFTPTDLSAGTVSFTLIQNPSDSNSTITNPSSTGTTGTFSISVIDTNTNTFTDSGIDGVMLASVAPDNPISNFTVSGNTQTDLESGTNPAEYEVSFDDAKHIASDLSGDTIALTFPSGYSIPQGSISTNSICSQSSCQYGTGSIPAHFGMRNGAIYVSSLTGSGNTLTIGLEQSNFEYPPDTISFYLMNGSGSSGSAGISNPTALGTTGNFSMSVDGGSAVTAPGVTITQAPDHLVFSTEPSCSAENDPENEGDCISGEAFSTQPVVTVKDYTGATDTAYNGSVTLFVGSGQGTLSGTLTEQAVNGVATFTNVNYHAGQDLESAVLGANATDGSNIGETGITDGSSNSFTSDIVATGFKVIEDIHTGNQPGGPGTLITLGAVNPNNNHGGSGFILVATDADGNFPDVDYNPNGKTFTLTDSTGALLSTHLSPNGTAPTIPDSADIESDFSGGQSYHVFNDGLGFTKAESLGSITISDGTLSGTSDPIYVGAGNIGGFTVTPSTTTPQAGVPFGVTVIAMDQYGNILNAANTIYQGVGQSYTGTVFITTDAATPYSLSPSIYTFKQADNGTKTFNGLIMVNNAQNNVSITVQDQYYDPNKNPDEIGSSQNFNVSAAPSGGGGGGGGGGGSVSIGGGATASSPNSAIINNGAISTQSPQVTLTLFTQTGTKMMISNSSNFLGATWEPYTLTKQWTLSPGNGQKTVYVKFMDVTGAVRATSQSVITLESSPIQTNSESVTPSSITSTNQDLFSKTLKVGVSDPQVKLLQKYLNTHGFIIAKSGVGSLGHENDYFGSLTKKAIIKLQKANNMTADGVVGSKTRKYLNSQS